jgi:hypothetical protein
MERLSALPSVTQVLSPWADFAGVPPAVLANAARRGSRVHAICSAHLQGLWIPEIPEDCRGYVDSFLSWAPMIEEVVLVEAELADPDLGFCGHPDLVALLKGDHILSIIDWKTPLNKGRLWRAQMAAYRHLARKAGIPAERVMTVRLRKEGGRPLVDEYTELAPDLAAFCSALNAFRFFHA